MPSKSPLVIRAVADKGSAVYFEFPARSVLQLAAGELRSIEAQRQAGQQVAGERQLRRLVAWLETACQDSAAVPCVPDQFTGWFAAQRLFTTKRRLASIYCPDCGKTYSKQRIERRRWSIPRPRGFSIGGASGSYFACPRGHKLHQIARRVS